MAQGSRGSSGSGKSGPSFSKAAAAKPAAGSSPATPPSGQLTSGRPPVRNQGPSTKGRAASKKGRQSVAAARRAKSGSDRTQLILILGAVVVLAAIVITGVVLYQKNSKATSDYGPSNNSVSTVANGVVDVSNGSAPPVTIDIYQDALCPNCQDFEHQFGAQIAQSVDQGKLGVRYHALTFLDQGSFSKDYSTRASAAMLCVAEDKSAPKGLFLKYLTHLYADDTKPAEQGSSDLSNQQLADLAKSDGASASAATCVGSGANVPAAQAGNTSGQAELSKLPGGVGTPRVVKDGQLVNINSMDWLTKLLPKT